MKKNKKKKSKSSASGVRAQSKGFSWTITASNNLDADIDDLKECLLAFKEKYTNQVLMCGWFLHNKDIYTPEQIEKYDIKAKAGDLKPAHFHFSILLSAKKDLKSIEKLFQQFWPNQYTAGKIVMNKNCYSGRFANEKDFANRMKYWFHWGDENRGKTIYSYNAAKAKTTFIYGITWKTFEKYISFQSKDLIESETFDDEFEEWMKIGFQIRTGKLDLKTCEDKYWAHWSKHKKYFCDCFADYIASIQVPPKHKNNFMICGEGGTFKSYVCKKIAQKLFPDMWYKIDDLKAGFQNVKKEKCFVFNDIRATKENGIKNIWGVGKFLNITDKWNNNIEVKVLFKTIKLFPELLMFNCSEKSCKKFFKKLAEWTKDDEVELADWEVENMKQFLRRFAWIWETSIENDYVIYRLLNADFKNENWNVKYEFLIPLKLNEECEATAEMFAPVDALIERIVECYDAERVVFDYSKMRLNDWEELQKGFSYKVNTTLKS